MSHFMNVSGESSNFKGEKYPIPGWIKVLRAFGHSKIWLITVLWNLIFEPRRISRFDGNI